MRIAFQRHGEWRADLHRGGAQRNERAHFGVTLDAARHDQRNALAFQPQFAQQLAYAGEHRLKVKTRIIDFVGPRGAEVSAGITRVLDDDGVGEALFAQPFPEHDTHASHVGQDRHQSDVRKILRQVRQVERQPRAHHDGVGAAGATLPHIGRILGDRFHHVDRDSAAAVRDFERHPDFTVERDQVESVEFVLVGASFGTLEKIGVMMAQVDAGNGAERACARDGAGQPVRRDAHAHAALHDRQQRAAAQLPARQRVRRRRARIVQQASLIDATSHARGRLRG